MAIKEILAKTILRTRKRIDSWFISNQGMNLYRGCIHNCVYCNGRNEKYQVNNIFGEDIEVKTNAIKILRKELKIKNKRKNPYKGFIMIGGGVGDNYQPVEEKYQLTRKTLQLLNNYRYPIHILTKSTLVERDIDILKEINQKNKVIISFSFSSTNNQISKIFEPGVPPPNERLNTIKKLKKEGFSCGIYLLPVIPFITDSPETIHETIKQAYLAHIDFIIFGGMTLKEGKQKEYFIKTLKKHYPDKIVEYENIYKNDKWGNAIFPYYKSINQTFNTIMDEYHIAKRIPADLFKKILEENDYISIILDQIDYILKTYGRKSPYGYASYQISQQITPISNIKTHLRNIKGIGPVTEKIILEILETKTSKYYEKLLYGR